MQFPTKGTFSHLTVREVKDKVFLRKIIFIFSQLSKKNILVEVKWQVIVIVVPFGEKKEKPFSPEGTDLHGDYDCPIKVVIKTVSN